MRRCRRCGNNQRYFTKHYIYFLEYMLTSTTGGNNNERYVDNDRHRGRVVRFTEVHPPSFRSLDLNGRFMFPRGPGKEKDGKQPRFGQVTLEINSGIFRRESVNITPTALPAPPGNHPDQSTTALSCRKASPPADREFPTPHHQGYRRYPQFPRPGNGGSSPPL